MATARKINYAILGLLNHEPMSGYEIKKRMDTSLRFFWNASYGSIYPTLASLAKDGLVTKSETENNRGKSMYAITEKGCTQLHEWLRLPVDKDELRYETLLKLFFGNEIGSSSSIEHIKNFESKTRKELPILQGAVKKLGQVKNLDDTHIYYLLTAMFGVKTYEAYLEWCEEAIEKLSHLGGTQ